MKRYNSVGAVIIGYLVSAILVLFLPSIPLSDILAVLIVILGGFIATYLSKINKAVIGLYMGILYSLTCLPILALYGGLSHFAIIVLVLIPILGFFGGYIAKLLRSRE